MKPQTFKADAMATYLLSYPDGSDEQIFGVRVRQHPQEPKVTVLEFAFDGDHGTALKIGRIEREGPTSMSFSVHDPPFAFMAGVVTVSLKTALI